MGLRGPHAVRGCYLGQDQHDQHLNHGASTVFYAVNVPSPLEPCVTMRAFARALASRRIIDAAAPYRPEKPKKSQGRRFKDELRPPAKGYIGTVKRKAALCCR